jgi:addiction module RelE/StbE family toxin
MSKSFEIRYLETAIRDLEDIFDYIAKDRPAAAVSLLDKLDHTISQLADFPEIGVVPKDDRLKRLGYRLLIIENYLVFYVIKFETIQIRRIIHGAIKYGFLV